MEDKNIFSKFTLETQTKYKKNKIKLAYKVFYHEKNTMVFYYVEKSFTMVFYYVEKYILPKCLTRKIQTLEK